MNKKSSDQKESYRQELINSIEPNFTFSKKPLNRIKINETNPKKINSNKIEHIKELKKTINSIQNCNLKNNSKNLILGDGNINSQIMIVGEAPGIKEEENNKTFQGESGILLEKMLSAIGIKTPPLAVPSSFVTIKLSILQISLKISACLIEFCPIFPSSTKIVSCG